MGRVTTVVLSLLLAVSMLSTDTASIGVLGATLGVALLAALVLSRTVERHALPRDGSPAGPVRQERCLRGAFRPQSSPDTPGRPRPRAPGNGHRPA